MAKSDDDKEPSPWSNEGISRKLKKFGGKVIDALVEPKSKAAEAKYLEEEKKRQAEEDAKNQKYWEDREKRGFKSGGIVKGACMKKPEKPKKDKECCGANAGKKPMGMKCGGAVKKMKCGGKVKR